MNTKSYSHPTKKYKYILSAVHMVYRLVNSTYNVKEMILRLTRLLCQFSGASSASVYIMDPQKQKVAMVAIFDNKINVLIDKKKDLEGISADELNVCKGDVIFEKHVIGLPLVAEENIGAIFVSRKKKEASFTEFDKEMLWVIAEQSVTAIKNLQLYEAQQKVALASMDFIGKLLKQLGHCSSSEKSSGYSKIVRCLGQRLKVNEEMQNNLYYASVLKDAGVMDVPYQILTKSSQLTPEEYQMIRSQPKKSAEMIKQVEFLKPVLPILMHHYEKYDGTGYPYGLRKEKIPYGARIIAVVEAFEAMVVERPYKKRRLTVNEAMQELKENSGTQFDPKVVGAFLYLSRQKKFRNYLRMLTK